MGKTKNQEMIQQLMDEGDYAPSYPFVLRSNLSALEKLLVGQMLNDIRMNGTITWKHQTYADKLGSKRQVIMKLFGKLKQLGILIANENNKQGGKSNTFEISFNAIEDYETCNIQTQVKPETSRPKPETSKPQPETFRLKPETSRPKPDTESIHIKKLKETNKENNKESKEDIFDNVSFFGNNKIKNSNQEYLDSRKKELTNIDIDLLGSTDFFDDLDI